MSTSFDRRDFMRCSAALLAVGPRAAMPAPNQQVVPPQPYGPVPNARQQNWQSLQTYGFVHFTINTFTGREWGYGDESPALFNPTDFDADQIVQAARVAGLRGLIFTAKHHDGFCLWPSKYTEHDISHSPYKRGKGDIVKEMSEACRRHGLLFGVYLSPWDRHHAEYGRPAYIDYFRAQLRELMTNYGPIFEVWFDGANGGSGYYGGANETRTIAPNQYYDWPNTWRIVRELQPEAVIWGGYGSDVRWIGNEKGHAGDPCWATMDEGIWSNAKAEAGVRNGDIWRPAEADVSIRPGWFWHATEDSRVKSPRQLMQIYYGTVGRGANLILNLAPDRRGQLPEPDLIALRGWRALREQVFTVNLADGATASASNVRGPEYAAGMVLDGKAETYWATEDGTLQPELVLQLRGPRRFDLVRLKECLALGQRVTTFAIDAWQHGTWKELAVKQAIGSQRLICLDKPVTTDRVRLRVLEAPACPAISEFALFLQPEMVDPPIIRRDQHGVVSIDTDIRGMELRYTTDGSTPTIRSPRYTQGFPLAAGGVVQAICVRAGRQRGERALRQFGPLLQGWRIAEASGQNADALLDESDQTLWRSPLPARVTVDLGSIQPINGVSILPAADLPEGFGSPSRYVCEVSQGGGSWQVVAEGEFPNIAANAIEQFVHFGQLVTGRYVRMTFPASIQDAQNIAVAGLGISQ